MSLPSNDADKERTHYCCPSSPHIHSSVCMLADDQQRVHAGTCSPDAAARP